jgi:ubiquinone/menaquinone biosynthesis C-methylase UbiE
MSWFRKAAPTDPLAVTMTGVKLGDRLLVVGLDDLPLVAALATKAGLTGRAVILDADEQKLTKAQSSVEQEGALVERTHASWGEWPFENDSFDIVVFRDRLTTMAPEDRGRSLREAHRVLRPGGRLIVIEGSPRGGFSGLMNRPRPVDPGYAANGGAAAVMKDAGFAGVRTLAERDGVLFVEGARRA